MKLVKRLIALVVLLVVLLIAGVVAGAYYIDSIAKAAVEKGGTYALGVPVKAGGASVGLLSGGFKLAKVDVANPSGFKAPSFVTLGEGEIKVSLGTLRKEIVEVPKFGLTDIDVSLEKSGGKSNYQVILDNMKKLESGAKPEPAKPGKKYVIKEVDIRNVKVHANLLPVGGELTQVNLTLDRVTLQDVGTAGKGVPLEDLASIIVKALMSAIADKGGADLPAELLGDLRGQLAGLKGLGDIGVKLTSGVVEGAGKAVEGVTKEAEKAAKDVQKKVEEGLKGVLPGKKK